MGFAAFVDDLEISRTTQLVSLLGRNLGIEIGQLVIILLTLPALYLLSRTRYYRPFFVATMIVLASVSIIWVFERMFEEDLGVNRFVDAAIKWPRSLVVVVVATAIVAAVYMVERRSGRLLRPGAPSAEVEPIAETESATEEPAPIS